MSSVSPSTPRNNFTGPVGLSFTVGSTAVQVNGLGRYCVAGNSQSHTVSIVQPNGSLVTSTNVNMSGCAPGSFVYNSVTSLFLQANTTYYLLSQETSGGDQFFDYSPVTPSSAGTVNGAVYNNGLTYQGVGPANYSYVPVNFLYVSNTDTTAPTATFTAPSSNATVSGASVNLRVLATDFGTGTASAQFRLDGVTVGSPVTTASCIVGFCTYTYVFNSTTVPDGVHTVTATVSDKVNNSVTASPVSITVKNNAPVGTNFILSAYQSSPRNNFSGFLGMSFNSGPKALAVGSLGRMCSSGNSGTHTVKLVNAATNQDVTGSSVSINMAGCTPGTFVYGALANPLNLPTNTNYYLVSQETSGGDMWWDVEQVVYAAGSATVYGPVFQTGANSYYSYNFGPYSYVPVDFKITTQNADTIPPSVYISTPLQGATVNPGATLTAIASDNVGVQSVTFYVDNIQYGVAITNPPYTTSLIQLISGTHTITAVASDYAGNQTTSTAVTVNYYDPNPLSIFPQLLTGFTLTAPRNNYTGWLGMKLQTSQSRQVNAIGRLCVSGNSQSHVLKVVSASNPGGTPILTQSVNMSGCIPGTIAYQLVSTVSLPAGTYYILSQETAGGDNWYDYSPVTSSVASLLGPVYSVGNQWVELGSSSSGFLNQSYVILDLGIQ